METGLLTVNVTPRGDAILFENMLIVMIYKMKPSRQMVELSNYV